MPAISQTIAASPAPDKVAVTIYRDVNRPPAQRPNLQWLNGYSLISETRRIAIPAGESQLRFEGVAGGIIPQSAIVTGLPDGIVERNRDAYLLSPGTLLDRSLGRRVHLRRTSQATGAVREQEVEIRSGAEGAVVLQTEDGFEALRCTGLAETPVYDRVPAELSARPTLSVRVRSGQAITATVTLSYLATGFDWEASYVATLAPDGRHVDLFAWLTLANGDETSFIRADTQAVAGRLNRAAVNVPPAEASPLRLQCWPSATTSDIEEEEAEEIVVTGSRVMMMAAAPPPPPPPPPAPPPPPPLMAQQENLGDLKLYRIPEPVTVAAKSQKQVAFLTRANVAVDFVYRRFLTPYDGNSDRPAERVLVSANVKQNGLGLPLPAGRIALFATRRGERILVGQGAVEDRTIGEKIDIGLGLVSGVRTSLKLVADSREQRDYQLTVSNDRNVPVPFEGEIESAGQPVLSPAKLGTRASRKLWTATIPANGRATLNYSIRKPR